MVLLDIEMPKCCNDCPLSDDSGDYPFCWALQQNRGYRFDQKTKRFPNCPLKPIEEKKEDSEIDKLKDMCRVLFNRCRAYGSCNGQMCVFCGMRTACDEMHSI